MPKNYLSEIEREDGTVLTIKDAEARAALDGMDPTLQQILQGVNDIKSSIGDVGEIVEEVLVGPPTLIEKTITENGTYAAEDDDADGYSSVTVNVSGGGGSSGNDVIFYDYDGSVVASYSAADFANLSAMPANPTHTGLTAQGWNWSLADAKTYVASYGKLNIGQMYITDDGKTRLYFIVSRDSYTIQLSLGLNENTELDVDWGDGSEHTSWTSDDYDSYKEHTYATAGKYVIVINIVSGSFDFTYFDSTMSSIYHIEIGSNISTPFSTVDAMQLTSLQTITIPFGLVSIRGFGGCYSLKSVVIPNSVTSIDSSAFDNCFGLPSITIPSSLSELSLYMFYNCYGLKSLIIPDSVTSVPGSFYVDEAKGLMTVTFHSSTPPTLSEAPNFGSDCIIRVPQGSLSAYTSAEYYPDPSEYIYEEY